MKYAIYDKATNAYLTKMIFDVGYSDNTQFNCEITEYITNARLLSTKEAADNVVADTESFKFIEKGRFVVHSFDDTLNDQYIISEAGNPTKVVDNITVDLNGNINVKYGTMMSHWSAMSLEYTVNRLNRLQEAISPKYGSWRATFDIYKVITIIDEKEHTHYQFIKVTDEGLDFAKDEEESSLSKRITSNWKYLYEESYKDRVTLNKRIEELEKANYELGEQVAERGSVANCLLDENNSLKSKVEAIKKEARDWKTFYENAKRDREVLTNVIDNIYDDLGSTDICKNLRETYDYIKGLSKLNYIKIHNDDTDDGTPIYITAMSEFKYIIDKIITIMESRELNQNAAFSATDNLRVARDYSAEIIYAIRNAIINNSSDAFDCIINRMKFDHDFNSDPFMAGVRENIKDICTAEKKNIANHELKNSEIARLTDERDKALERAEKLKGIANSVYGMTIPSRCNGKQMFCDIATGKKILVDKKKYDELVEWIDAINTTYDTMFFMNKPAYLPIMIEHLNDLTK